MNWKKVKLGDILKRRRETIKILPNEVYKLVTIRLYHKGVTQRSSIKGLDIKSPMSSVKVGDFILSGIDARNGAFGIVPQELDGAIITNDFWCLEPDEQQIDKEFLLHLTSTDFFDHICKQSSEGTTQRIRLQREKFFDFSINLPSLAEQKIILVKLKSHGLVKATLSAELAHQLALVKQLRQQFLQEAIQGKLIENTTDSAHELLQKIKTEKAAQGTKQKPLPTIKAEEIPFDIPENWVWCKLGAISEIKRGKSPQYPEYGISKMLNQKCIRWYVVDTGFSKSIDIAWFNSIQEDFIVRENDVLVNSTGDGTIGRCAIADNLTNGFIFDSHILNIRSHINQNYICYFINSEFGQSLVQVLKGATSTKQTELGVNNLVAFTLPLPPLSEQQLIVEKLDKLMAMCDSLSESIQSSVQQNEQLLREVLWEALQSA